MKDELAKLVMELTNRKAEIIKCDEEFEISVSHSITVAKCKNYTDLEQQSMAAGLARKWRKEAESECGKNSECQEPQLVQFTPVSSCAVTDSGTNVWKVDAVYKTKCTASTMRKR